MNYWNCLIIIILIHHINLRQCHYILDNQYHSFYFYDAKSNDVTHYEGNSHELPFSFTKPKKTKDQRK